MSKRWFVRTLTVVVLSVFGFTATAFAQTWVADTRLTLNVSDSSIDRGDRVVFSGRLRSERRKCRRNQKISLFKNGDKVATTRTNARGKYSISKKVRRDSNWQAKYKGNTFGTHPNTKVCNPSKSRKRHVEVD